LGKAAFDYIRLYIPKVLDGLNCLTPSVHNFHQQHHL
jgi:hypothetical protein